MSLGNHSGPLLRAFYELSYYVHTAYGDRKKHCLIVCLGLTIRLAATATLTTAKTITTTEQKQPQKVTLHNYVAMPHLCLPFCYVTVTKILLITKITTTLPRETNMHRKLT